MLSSRPNIPIEDTDFLVVEDIPKDVKLYIGKDVMDVYNIRLYIKKFWSCNSKQEKYNTILVVHGKGYVDQSHLVNKRVFENALKFYLCYHEEMPIDSILKFMECGKFDRELNQYTFMLKY